LYSNLYIIYLCSTAQETRSGVAIVLPTNPIGDDKIHGGRNNQDREIFVVGVGGDSVEHVYACEREKGREKKGIGREAKSRGRQKDDRMTEHHHHDIPGSPNECSGE